jgi:hypothetical protein
MSLKLGKRPIYDLEKLADKTEKKKVWEADCGPVRPANIVDGFRKATDAFDRFLSWRCICASTVKLGMISSRAQPSWCGMLEPLWIT